MMKKRRKKNDQIIEICNTFFEKNFLEQFENDSIFINMFEINGIKRIKINR